jgi:hypothetical protein
MSVLLQDCKGDDWITFDWSIPVTTSSPFLQSQLASQDPPQQVVTTHSASDVLKVMWKAWRERVKRLHLNVHRRCALRFFVIFSSPRKSGNDLS